MKSLLLALAFTLLGSVAGLAEGDDGWMTDPPKALAQARADKKILLMDFTGSDWCGWCIKLDNEVFSQKEFQDYARKNLVLLKVDFPHGKPQTEAEKTANQNLAQKYGIQGFPTIIVLDPQGRQIGELGYMKGGPPAFIAALKKIK